MPVDENTPAPVRRGGLSTAGVPEATTKPRRRSVAAEPAPAAPTPAPPATDDGAGPPATSPAPVRQMSIRLSSELFEAWNDRMEALALPRTPAAIAALRALLELPDDELVQKVAFESFQRDRDRARRSS